MRQEVDPLRAKLEEELAAADAAQTALCEWLEHERLMRARQEQQPVMYEI